jgi:hypothetical protein
MSKSSLVFSVLIFLFVTSSVVYAENRITFSDSDKPILQAMELSLKGNSLNSLFALQSENEDLAYKVNEPSDSLKLKNPNTALFYAAVPGFLIHGMGHFYATKPITGTLLLGVEMLGLLFMVRGAFSGFDGSSDKGEEVNGIVGVALFIGSWAYDMIGAPLAVGKENERILQSKSIYSIYFN